MPSQRSRDPTLRHFGDAVRAVRRERGFSQEGLALEADLNRSYMGAVERGEENISLKSIAKIAAVLKVRPSVLLEKGGL